MGKIASKSLFRPGRQDSRISRRSFLRGAAGATVALPWMESLAASRTTVAKRMLQFYVPIGVNRRAFFPGEGDQVLPDFGKFAAKKADKKVKAYDFPIGSKPLQQLTPTLQPLESVKEKVSLITGLMRTKQEGTDVHAQCASCYLSSADPNVGVLNSQYPLSRSLDHIVADTIGSKTPFPTLEFSCNPHNDMLESIYFDNISWYGTGFVAPSMKNPRQIYERLFKTKDSKNSKNITDLILADAHSLKRDLGYTDTAKFEEYFEGIRSIETRMARLESMTERLSKVKLAEPVAAYLPRGEFIRVMADLMVTALQTGLTNVGTFMVGPERWNTPYMFEGISDEPLSHHLMSHNQSKHSETLSQVDRFHMEQFSYIVQKMDQIQEGNGTSLLDNSILTYGSGLGDGATHKYVDLPIVVAGGKSMSFKGGQHINVKKGTPLSNLWLTQANCLGVDINKFSDSSSRLEEPLS